MYDENRMCLVYYFETGCSGYTPEGNIRVYALIPSPTQIFTSYPMNVVFKVFLIIQI